LAAKVKRETVSIEFVEPAELVFQFFGSDGIQQAEYAMQ